jgi:hypothetical protein
MNEHDDDIERVLSRYRPASPEAALRDRIVRDPGSARPSSNRLTWLAFAAGLIAAAALHMQASRTFNELSRPGVENAAIARAAAIDEMTALLGGGDAARRAAEQGFDATQSIRAVAASASVSLESIWIP